MMKQFLLGSTLVLSLGALVSCSSEENGPVPGDATTTGAEKFMAVRIKSVSSPGSRAEEGGFEVGEGNENTITAAQTRFYFFTEDGLPFVMSESGVNGTVTNTNMVAPISVNTTTTPGQVKDLTAVLVLGTPTEAYKGDSPAKVLCIANSTVDYAKFANTRLEDIYREIVNIPESWNTFMMTSSTYVKDNEIVYYTDVTDKIKDSQSAAENDPANIFIERLAVKIRATGLGDYAVKEKDENGNYTDKTFLIRNTDEGVPLYVTLTGWKPYNTANRAYAMKNLSKDWVSNAPFEAWNIAELHRSYWAASPSLSFMNNNYNLYEESTFSYGNFDSSKPTENIFYTYENTLATATSVSEVSENTTAIIVRGVVHKEGETAGLDFCRWGGDYYHADYLKEVIADAYNADVDEANKATAADVTFVPDATNPNHYYASVKGEDFRRIKDILWWKDGVTSYYVNIEHLGGKFGVVRNHIYDYTFSNVIGLGVPGNNPEKPTEEESYLAARVYVLDWHVVSNVIDLE